MSTIPIVLTASIIPNGVNTHQCDWRVRRQQYLAGLAFYRQFSKVYFLENSRYDLSADRAFREDEDCRMVKIPVSDCPGKGKGYQEFQMLDVFVKSMLTEDCFVKITGRYIYSNFQQLYSSILAERAQHDILIDSFMVQKTAITSLFYIAREAYCRCLANSYLQMNDPAGVWAEHVVYRILKGEERKNFFAIVPRLVLDGKPNDVDIAKLGMKGLQRWLLRRLSAGQLLR